MNKRTVLTAGCFLVSTAIVFLPGGVFAAGKKDGAPAEKEVRGTAREQPPKWRVWTKGGGLRGVTIEPLRSFDAGYWAKHGAESLKDFGPMTREDVEDLRDYGANIMHALYVGPHRSMPPYELDPLWLKWMDTIVDWAEEVGIWVTIGLAIAPGVDVDTVWDPVTEEVTRIENVFCNREARAAYVKNLQFVAGRYKDRPAFIGLSLMHEPHVDSINLEELKKRCECDPGLTALFDYNEMVVEMTAAVRAVAPELPIIVESLFWSHIEHLKYLEPTGDPYTIYGFHAYEPRCYTQQHDELNPKIRYPSTVMTEGAPVVFDRAWVENSLQQAVEFQDRYRARFGEKPVIYISEMGGAGRHVPGDGDFLDVKLEFFEKHGWHYNLYCWRCADGAAWYGDLGNYELGPDPDNHTRRPDNSVFGVFRRRWKMNVDFPPVESVNPINE